MKSNSLPLTNKIDCNICQATLVEYVRLELNGQEVEQIYPNIAFHLETCPRCEAAYYREFRSQGRHKSLAELQQIGQRSQVAGVIQQIVTPATPDPPTPHPSWREVVLEQGRAWLEQERGRLRQLQLSLAALGGEFMAGGDISAPALSGLMGAEPVAGRILGRLEVRPPGGNIELKLVLWMDPAAIDEDLYRLDVAVSYLKERFGDFSGARVALLGGSASYAQETDALGKVSFAGLPKDQLTAMNLIVTLPD